jgi:chloramphenicol-sensitive protein RarD
MLDRQGVIAAVLAYSAWGFFPIYWQLLKRVSPLETMSHRVIWSLAFYAAIALGQKRLAHFWSFMKAPHSLKSIALASGFIAFNWLLYVWAVTHGHVMETSLGYFINPLLSVAIGSFFFKERLTPLQKISLLLALLGVAWLTFDYGRPPWIALGLALSFAIYGVLKKTIPGDATLISMAETTILLPFALVGAIAIRLQSVELSPSSLATVSAISEESLHTEFWRSTWHMLQSLVLSPPQLTTLEWIFIVGGGTITGIPLLLFGIAAQRLPLSILGFFQYLAPTLQFLTAVLFFHEPLDSSRLAGFFMIWVALGIFLYQLRQASIKTNKFQT